EEHWHAVARAILAIRDPDDGPHAVPLEDVLRSLHEPRCYSQTIVSATIEQVREALTRVRYPGFTRDIVSFGIVRELSVEDGRVTLALDLGASNPAVAGPLE